jgi:hypothetical protein
MPHTRFTFTTSRFTMFSEPAGQSLPLPDAVREALFKNHSSAGFMAAPAMQSGTLSPATLSLYQWAQETARAQVCERRIQRLAPHAN